MNQLPQPQADTSGILLLIATAIGWGLNWPATKMLLAELPLLTTRAITGGLGFLLLLAVALGRKERLQVPLSLWPRLVAAALLNVTAWMGLAALALVWLSAAEATIVCYTMPVWAVLFAWVLLGERPRWRGLIGLVMAGGGIGLLLLGPGFAIGLEKLPGLAAGGGAAVLFAGGAVAAKRWPLGLPPLRAAVWQVGLGMAPLILGAVLFDPPFPHSLSAAVVAVIVFAGIVPLGLCYLTWFAALRRLPAGVATAGTLLTPLIGVVASALLLGEEFGARQAVALVLTLGGVALALRS